MPMKTPIERIAEAAETNYFKTFPPYYGNQNSITPSMARAVAAEVLRGLLADIQRLIDPWGPETPSNWCIEHQDIMAYAASLGVELNKKENGK